MWNSDSIEKTVKHCGCVVTSKLDIIENEITKAVIKICKNHYLINLNKIKYTYNKSQNIYILNCEISNNIKKNKIKKISSDIDLTLKENKDDILQFGKYKHKSFDYVYNHDKLYCYNLSFWKHNKLTNVKNKSIYEFINYVRNEIRCC